MNQREKEELRQLWIARMCEFGESGMTQEEWCRSHNISYSTFRYWGSKFKKDAEAESQQASWLKVDMSTRNEIATIKIPEIPKSTGGINIRFGEFTVELQNGYDPQLAFEVLRMLTAL